MKTVTVEQILGFNPCSNYSEARIRKIAGDKNEWTALDILKLEEISEADRLWVVLREEFIPAEILHEFACQCAENALALIENPDPRSVAAIAAKRAWFRGKITNGEFTAAAAEAWAKAAARAWASVWAEAAAAARKQQVVILIKLIETT